MEIAEDIHPCHEPRQQGGVEGDPEPGDRGQDGQGVAQGQKIRFGVGPLQPTPAETTKAYEPFFAYVARKLDRDFAFTVGADEYVLKPFRTADLVAKLAMLVPSGNIKPLPAPKPSTAPAPQMAGPSMTPSPTTRAR